MVMNFNYIKTLITLIAIWLSHFRRDTDPSVFSYSRKQARAKIRAHISGPWFWLQPVCLQHYTFKIWKILQKWLFSSWCRRFFIMAAILYPRL